MEDDYPMTLRIAIIGNDFNSSHPVFSRVPRALDEAAISMNVRLSPQTFSTDKFLESTDELKAFAGIFVVPSPFRNPEGLYHCAQFAREKQRPWLSVCGGTQYALVEFGRHVLQLPDCDHVEHDPDCSVKFVNFLPDRYRVSNDGPLKLFPIDIRSETRAASIYSTTCADEMFFANYMLNLAYYDRVTAAGLVSSGTFDDHTTPCLIELRDHPFFMGALFQPQITSTPESPHPLICAFLEAAIKSGNLDG
jgi:CTP synthase (UTP-ammonia lyase)